MSHQATWTPRKGTTLKVYVQDMGGGILWDGSTLAGKIRSVFAAVGISCGKNLEVTDAWPARKLVAAADELDRRLADLKCTTKWIMFEGPAAENEMSWYDIQTRGAEPDMAIHMRTGIHVGFVTMHDYRQHSAHVVSQEFVDTVRKHQFCGLEFLPIPPENGTRQDGWWEVFATHPLGRGIDHPVLDSARVDRYVRSLGRTAMHARRGKDESGMHGDLVDMARLGDPWIARQLTSRRFVIKSSTRYIREELPARVDFAYKHLSLGMNPRERLLFRDIVCSRRAKERLVAAGMLRPEDVDTERVRRQKLIDALPPRVVMSAAKRTSRRQVLSRLRALWEHPCGRWGASGPIGTRSPVGKAIAASKKVPGAWKEIAPQLPLIIEDPESATMDLWRAAKPDVSGWVFDRSARGDDPDTPTRHDIEIGSTIFGDWYGVRTTDRAMPANAKVRLWDHETGSIKRAWESVEQFALFLIEFMDTVNKRHRGTCRSKLRLERRDDSGST
ncbi:MAG: hypothetical protein HBSAPP03_14250 [Phycisphaerae bacterium]|nr:MAG: hypothetical protein HBSAPP03_14250 [Phycisphaerae bacterium]